MSDMGFPLNRVFSADGYELEINMKVWYSYRGQMVQFEVFDIYGDDIIILVNDEILGDGYEDYLQVLNTEIYASQTYWQD